jgi:PDZ domain-containing protein
VVGVLLVLAALVIASSIISVPYYALAPGDALPVSALITVPAQHRHPVKGQILLTDVEVESLKLIDYFGAELDPDDDVVPTGALTGGLPVSEFDAQGVVDMEESQMTAHAVALRQLGYSVPERDAGVTIYVIDPGSPAWRTLQVGDVVTSVNGTPTTNPQALVNAVRTQHPGDVVRLQVGTIADPTPGRTVSVRLSSTVEDHQKVAFLGIGDPQVPIAAMGTQPTYDFPFAVSINSDNIGGPSAGLAWTLGIINTVSGGHLNHPPRRVGGRRRRRQAEDRRRGAGRSQDLLRPPAGAQGGQVHGDTLADGVRGLLGAPGARGPTAPGGRPRSGGGRVPRRSGRPQRAHRLAELTLELTPGCDTHRPHSPRR